VRTQWAAAPIWLRALCLLGIPWWVLCMVVGVPLLVTEGPGLPVLAAGFAGVVIPWVVLLSRDAPR
jgi:hypothetical protein